MYRLIEFIRSIYVVVLFVVLECCAITYYAHSTIYTQAQMLSYSNNVVGGMQGLWSGVRSYFYLSSENEKLTRRVALLERELSMVNEHRGDLLLWDSTTGELSNSEQNVGEGDVTDNSSQTIIQGAASHRGWIGGSQKLDGAQDDMSADVSIMNRGYTYMVAQVISNSINKLENYIVINRGERDGVRKNMALLSSSGEMIGHVTATSQKYAIVVSLLNTKFKTSGKIKGQEYMGSITWRAESRYMLELSELSKYAEVNKGDTIISTGYSQIFPEGIIIGTVASSSLNKNKSAHNVEVEISADMSKLNNVIIVNNTNFEEVEELMLEAN